MLPCRLPPTSIFARIRRAVNHTSSSTLNFRDFRPSLLRSPAPPISQTPNLSMGEGSNLNPSAASHGSLQGRLPGGAPSKIDIVHFRLLLWRPPHVIPPNPPNPHHNLGHVPRLYSRPRGPPAHTLSAPAPDLVTHIQSRRFIRFVLGRCNPAQPRLAHSAAPACPPSIPPHPIPRAPSRASPPAHQCTLSKSNRLVYSGPAGAARARSERAGGVVAARSSDPLEMTPRSRILMRRSRDHRGSPRPEPGSGARGDRRRVSGPG